MANFPSRDLSLVQLKIMARFLRAEKISYSDAKPEDIDNDLYKYHLNFLLEKEIVQKTNEGYSLTDYGKYLTQNLDIFGNQKQFFKVSVLPYVISDGKLLMQKRLRHPYYGDTETVSGKIHPGEVIIDAANRKLKEETGLTADFTFLGVVRKIRKVNGDIFEDTIYHVCRGINPKGEIIAKNEFGENFWVEISDALKIVRKNITYGKYTEEIINRVSKNTTDLFYFTEQLNLPKP